mmetsp:Transcript_9767/g.16447  ORF Transcript_9767/g.16447 Transcript_9767/m.16447 type:complete len:84 (+) Transcript_9767:197-448(+)
MSLFLIVCILVQQGQLYGYKISDDERFNMTIEEKGFRYRAKFMTEITLYCLTLLLSVFLTLNHLMSVNRKRADYSKKYKELKG